MKKLVTLQVIGLLIVLVAVMSVSAMPDEGSIGSRAVRSGSSVQVVRDEGASLDCLQSEDMARLTREELKDLRIEMVLNGNSGSASAPAVACTIQNEVATK